MSNLAEQVRANVGRSGGLTSEHMSTIRRLAPQERSNTPTRALAESYQRRVLNPGRNLSERNQRSGGMDQLGEAFEQRLTEAWRRGVYQINGNDGISIEELTDRIVRLSEGSRFAHVMSKIRDGQWDRRLQEATLDALDQSQYSRYMNTVVRLGTYEMAQEASVAPILSLLGRVQVSCDQRTLASNPALMQLGDMLGESASGEQTPFFGLDDPAEIALPKRKLIKLAYAINRDAVCNGLDVALRAEMSRMAIHLDEYWAPHITQVLFDKFVNASDNEWAFQLDGVKWRTYYQPQATDGAVPYENMLFNKTDLRRTDFGLFIAIESLLDRMEDFRTGRPVNTVENVSIVGTGRQQAQYIREALGAVNVSHATGGPGNEVVEVMRGGRDGWNGSAFTNLWIRKYLDEFMKVTDASWTAAERQEAIDRSLVAGDVSDAMLIQVEWERDTLPMPTEWANFNQEIIWGQKVMEKTGLAITQPQKVVCVKGLPDSEAVPAPDPSSIT